MWNGPATVSSSVRFTNSGAGAGAGVRLTGGDFCANAGVEHKRTRVQEMMKIVLYSIPLSLVFMCLYAQWVLELPAKFKN